MPLSGFDRALWLVGFFCHLTLLLVLILKRRYRQFPVFGALICLNIARTLTLFFVRRSASVETYYYVYWGLAFFDLALQCAVIGEIAVRVFRPTGRWSADVRRGWSLLLLLAFAVGLALTLLAPSQSTSVVENLLVKGNFFSGLFFSELFVGMLVLAVRLGLPWRSHAQQIATGLGGYLLFNIVTEAAHVLFGKAYAAEADLAINRWRGVAYLICVMYWIGALWKEAPTPSELPNEVAVWLKEVGQLLRPHREVAL